MRKFLNLILPLTLIACSTAPKAAKPKYSELEKQVYSLAVQGDVKAAIEKFNSVPESKLSPQEKELKNKYIARFVRKEPVPITVKDPFVKDVLSAYHEYWNEALMKTQSQPKLYELLFTKLKAVSQSHFKEPVGKYTEAEAKKLVQFIKIKLKDRGYWGIYGRTAPHLELMLWKKQTEKEYLVKFHDSSQKVNVVLLNDFLTQGWGNYATFGYSGTGGWAEKDKLFCVASGYDLESERFKVSYLAHEGRHFSDYKKFPKLEQPELEYRAKLTELIMAKETSLRLIDKFRTGAKNDRKYPHAFANHTVYQNIKLKVLGPTSEGWEEPSVPAIQKAASQLLDEHTKLLESKGSKSMKQVF